MEISEKCFIFEYLCACFKNLSHRSAPFPTVFSRPPHTLSSSRPPLFTTHSADYSDTPPLSCRHTYPRADTPLSADHLFHAPAPHATAPPSCLNSALHRVVTCRPLRHALPTPNNTYIYTTPPLPFSHLPTPFTTARRGLSPLFPRSDFRTVPLPQISDFSDFMNTYLVIMTSKSNETTLFSPVSNNNSSNSPFYVCKIIRIFNISPDFL